MPKPWPSTALAVLIVCTQAVQGCADQPTSVPVMLYPDTDHGTCSIGLQVNAGGAELRAGPGTNYPVIAKLKAGHVVSGCNEKNGYDGVIDGTDESCSVGISVAKDTLYDGPCQSGWIDQRSVTGIYG